MNGNGPLTLRTNREKMAERLPVSGDGDAMASQILEIIGGIAPKALQPTLEEPHCEMDAWPMEEGDDSVFYSDDETPEVTLRPRGPVNSEAEDMLQEEESHYKVTQIVHQYVPQEDRFGHERKKVENRPKLKDVHPTSAIPLRVNEEVGRLNGAPSGVQSVRKDPANRCPSPKATKEVEAPLAVYHKSEKSHINLQGNSLESSEGRPIPVLSKKKSSHPRSFNHLTSSKYSTVSYRRIRRGNTRQKIEEFEYLTMNL